MTSVYVAAPWTCRETARIVAERLAVVGFRITHDWWNKEATDDDHETLQRHALADMTAVLDCDIFVLLNVEKSEGKAVEQGIALARSPRPRLVGVGPRYTNIFQNLHCWEWVESTRELVPYLMTHR